MKPLTKTWLIALAFFATPSVSVADDTTEMTIYGFAMLDMGYQSKSNDPDWYDVVRPTKLPVYKNEFGADGNYAGMYPVLIALLERFDFVTQEEARALESWRASELRHT